MAEPTLAHSRPSRRRSGSRFDPLSVVAALFFLLAIAAASLPAFQAFRSGAESAPGLLLLIGLAGGLWLSLRNMQQAAQSLKQLATTDPLTGRLNRRAFFDNATREFERGQRYQTPLTVMMLDTLVACVAGGWLYFGSTTQAPKVIRPPLDISVNAEEMRVWGAWEVRAGYVPSGTGAIEIRCFRQAS